MARESEVDKGGQGKVRWAKEGEVGKGKLDWQKKVRLAKEGS